MADGAQVASPRLSGLIPRAARRCRIRPPNRRRLPPNAPLKPKRSTAKPGWIVRDGNGRILRSFVDTNGDNVVDLWCYYQGGIEVYRDIDRNFNGKPDQYRWLNTAGTRWGSRPRRRRQNRRLEGDFRAGSHRRMRRRVGQSETNSDSASSFLRRTNFATWASAEAMAKTLAAKLRPHRQVSPGY